MERFLIVFRGGTAGKSEGPPHEPERWSAWFGELGINCDFCGKHYSFDKVDCAQLFAADVPVESLIPASGSIN